jgi:hypothetical protein
MLPSWWVQAYGPDVMFLTTLDKRDPQQRQRLLRSMQDETDVAKDAINTILPMIGYTASPASRIVDGEIQEWVRCVIHCSDGRDVACGSLGVVKSLMLISQLDRPAPWNPPLAVKLVARSLPGGKQWYTLIPVDAEAPPAGARKGK